MTDAEMEALLFHPIGGVSRLVGAPPDRPAIHREIRRPDVTLSLLWKEYRAVHPDGYGYSRFCVLHRRWNGRLAPVMRQVQYVCNHSRFHSGLPACQHIRAARVDAAVADTFLTALAPAERDALSRARQARNQVDDALRANAEREVERTRARRCCAVLSRKWFSTGG